MDEQEEEILKELENKTQVEETTSSTEKIDYWENADIEPKKIDPAKLNKSIRTFTYVKNQVTAVTNDEDTIAIATFLSKKGYIFRHNGSSEDATQNKILAIPGISVEHYIPWKKYNEKYFPNTIEKKIAGLPYHIATAYHKGYPKLSPGVRTILANNVISMLGKSCKDPSTLLLMHTENGAEKLGNGIDYKALGNAVFPMQIAQAASIPIFNVKADDVKERLKTFIKSREENEDENI